MNAEEQFFKEKPESNIFKQVLYKYLPFWPLFAVTVSVSMFIYYLDLRSQTPMYVASARILLKDQRGGDTKALDALNIFTERKIMDNEIVTLRSLDLMQEVVKELDLYATVYNKGNVRTEELYKSTAPVKFIAVDKENINLWKTLFFSMDWKNNRIVIDNQKVPFADTLNIDGNKYLIEVNNGYNKAVVGKNFFVTFSGP
ncbi:MAG TPA: hypothetical protein PL128_08000, partial [Ginsengibacter sp.]|nr:hypothetical protein [Ginsengibacter sp.]